jgi:hypothetical protein
MANFKSVYSLLRGERQAGSMFTVYLHCSTESLKYEFHLNNIVTSSWFRDW